MDYAIISRNLRRLRQERSMTQEQLATHLGVSPQSISRWECGNTLPDILLLPELARLYGVTVDDFFREDAQAYPSYAQRLLAVYEDSGKTGDFLAAEQEFLRLSPQECTPDDLRAWGVLYHYMMNHCARLAEQKLEQAMKRQNADPRVILSAAQQKIALLCDLGRGVETAEKQAQALEQDPSDPQKWLLCVAARHNAGENEKAWEVAREGLRRFPDYGLLYAYAGDICRALKRYEEAFSCWQRAKELDPSLLDGMYAMADCYEELGQYETAGALWHTLTQELLRRGMGLESRYTEKRRESCAGK